MGEASKLALTTTWWVTWRDVEPVQSALTGAFAEYWEPLVGRALTKNKRHGRKPSTYAELADMLSRNWVNFWRWRKGESTPSVQDMLSLAGLLGISVDKLFPSECDRIARATSILCRRTLTPSDTLAYANYRLAQSPTSNGHLDPQAVEGVRKKMEKHFTHSQGAEESIWRVVHRLEPVLQVVSGLAL